MKNKTLGEFLDIWLNDVVKGSVRYSTFTSYNGYVNNHIKRLIGDIILENLKPLDIQRFVCKLNEEKRIGSRTINIIISMLAQALSYAEDYEIIIKNPCRRIKLPKIEEQETMVFSNLEQTKIEKAILNSNDNRYYGILLALYTGLRIGEVCALRWENVDFTNKSLQIKKAISLASVENGKTTLLECEPKTKRSKRTIQLPEFIIKILRDLRKSSISIYVFSMKNGGFIQPRVMQLLHKRLLEKAGVQYKSFHVLRHTFATRAAELNTDPKTISETLGHSNTMITLNRYTHSLKQQKQKMMNGFNTYFKSKKLGPYN